MELNSPKKQAFSIINFEYEERASYNEKICRDGMITWGLENNYPNYLLSLLGMSGKHAAIVKGKAQLIGGNGFNETNLSRKALQFIENPYNSEDLNAVIAKATYDLEIFGCYALNIVWSRDRESISMIKYLEVCKLRIFKDKEGGTKYWMSEDWNNKKITPIEYQPFDEKNREVASTIYFFSEYRPGNGFYPTPEYISGVDWIEMEHEIAQFHLKNVKNGFAPSYIISFNSGLPAPEEMDDTIANLERKYKGTMNAGKVIFTFAEDKEHAPEISPITSNANDEKFIALNKSVEDGIYQAHRVTNPALFGVLTPGKLGNTQELAEELKRFNDMYVIPKQMMIERTVNYFAGINGIREWLTLNRYEITIPIIVSTADILSILSTTLSVEIKRNLLIHLGVEEEKAALLVPEEIVEPNIITE